MVDAAPEGRTTQAFDSESSGFTSNTGRGQRRQ